MQCQLQRARYELMVSAKTEWLKVPLDHLVILGLAKRVSPFSKRDGKSVWLERSVDAERFRSTFLWYTGSQPKEKEQPVEHETARKLPAYFH